jgi:RNA-binding protein YhbY
MKQIKKLQIGKKGLTPEFITQLKNVFEREQIIKISILKSACRNKKDAEKIGEDLVNELGKNFSFRLIGYVLTVRKYRKNVRE